MSGHHNEHAGLQSHSVGDLYPWSIVVVDNAERGDGYIVAKHAISGVELPRRRYVGSAGPSFNLAHSNAEHDAKAAIVEQRELDKLQPEQITQADRDLLAELLGEQPQRPQPVALWEYAILVPLQRDSDRRPHSLETWEAWQTFLADVAGGYSLDSGDVYGVWRDDSGASVTDTSRRYRVAVAVERVNALLDSLAHWAKRFDQTCLYVSRTSDATRLIYAN